MPWSSEDDEGDGPNAGEDDVVVICEALFERVMRATAVIGVRPPTVLSFEHSHVDVSQSQSHEWPGGLVEGW